MKKALKIMKFGFFLSLIFVLGLVFSGQAVLAKKGPSVAPYSFRGYYYHYVVYPYNYNYSYFSIFAKNRDTDDHKFVVPTKTQVKVALEKILK